MYDFSTNSVSTTTALIDNRNERPMLIALATIISVWSMALMLSLASAHFVF
jgi:hypothetical protein